MLRKLSCSDSGFDVERRCNDWMSGVVLAAGEKVVGFLVPHSFVLPAHLCLASFPTLLVSVKVPRFLRLDVCPCRNRRRRLACALILQSRNLSFENVPWP